MHDDKPIQSLQRENRSRLYNLTKMYPYQVTYLDIVYNLERWKKISKVVK